jgi:hypothetical protein
MAHRSDAEIIQTTRNTARFFVEHRQMAWVALVATLLWGVYGYTNMPKRKDPDIPVRVASASCAWPGVSAQEVEQLVTRPIEQAIAGSNALHKPGPGNEFAIQSITLPGLAVVRLQLADSVNDTKPFFNDLNLRLNALNANLPQGAGPIQFNGDFGDTAALMLTVASPTESPVEIGVRAQTIERAIRRERASFAADQAAARAALIVAFPRSVDPHTLFRLRAVIIQGLSERGAVHAVRPLDGAGFVGFDAAVDADDSAYLALARQVGRRHPASATRDDHGRGDRLGADPAGDSRRPAVATTVLCADRGAVAGYLHRVAAGEGLLRNLRVGPEDHQVGTAD